MKNNRSGLYTGEAMTKMRQNADILVDASGQPATFTAKFTKDGVTTKITYADMADLKRKADNGTITQAELDKFGFANSAMVQSAFEDIEKQAAEAAKLLEADGISARVINIHTIKPIDKEIILKAAKETGLIITAEEHSIIGGLGSAVAETVAEECPVPVVRIGVNDEFGHSGPAADLLKEFGLCKENIVAKTKEAVKKFK